MQAFATFADYDTRHDTPKTYQVQYDWLGPMFYAPSHCVKQTDYGHPKKMSPLIGIIGEETDMTDSIIEYYKAITGLQHDNPLTLAATPTYKK